MDHFIPNDTYIADGSRVALITGANCSGKSVYLKQVKQTCRMRLVVVHCTLDFRSLPREIFRAREESNGSQTTQM